MNTQIRRKKARRLSLLATVSAAVSLAASGWAVAAPGALGAPAVGYRLAAQLTVAQEVPAATAPAAAKGDFDRASGQNRASSHDRGRVAAIGLQVREAVPQWVAVPRRLRRRPGRDTAEDNGHPLDACLEADVLGPQRHGNGRPHPPRRQGRAGPVAIPLWGPCSLHRQGRLTRDRRPGNSTSPRRRLRQRPHDQEHERRDPRPDREDYSLAADKRFKER